MKNWANLQTELPETATIIYSIVDLHAITVPYDCESLGKKREEMWWVLYAVGIDMDRCVVFEQSAVGPFRAKINEQVPEHTQLHWILSSLAPMGLLNRMTQWKVGKTYFAELMAVES
jgi:tryptophanyl-tRNA synthetase